MYEWIVIVGGIVAFMMAWSIGERHGGVHHHGLVGNWTPRPDPLPHLMLT